MNRATNGDANIDRNPGGSNLKMGINKWYKIRVEFSINNQISVYLDGDRVFDQVASIPSVHYIVTGYDEQVSEIIIKVVSSTEKDYTPTIKLNAAKVNLNGKVITLSSANKRDENTMNEPTKIIPVTTEYKKFKKNFKFTFKPNSFTIIRIKAEK